MNNKHLFYSGKIKSTNPNKYGIADSTQLSGHRQVKILEDLFEIPEMILSESGDNTDNDAIGQLWYVQGEECFYQLIDWENKGNVAGWEEFKGGNSEIDLSDYYTKEEITSLIPSLEGYAKEEDIPVNTSDLVNDSGFITDNELNSYAKIDGLPEVISGWGFGTYTKPNDGIPSNDLSNNVQISLGKADTALQPEDINELNENVISLGNIVDELEKATISTDKLEDNAVTTNKILDGNVTLAKLENNLQLSIEKAESSLQSDSIINSLESEDTTKSLSAAQGKVLKGMLDNLTIGEDRLDNNAVTTNKIKNGNVTVSKLSEGVQTSLGLADSALQLKAVPEETDAVGSFSIDIEVDPDTGVKTTTVSIKTEATDGWKEIPTRDAMNAAIEASKTEITAAYEEAIAKAVGNALTASY